jgi:hypothetical protein
MARRGKTIAFSIIALAAAALGGGVIVMRERLLEAWHIRKLRSADEDEAFRAAEALGRLRSTRAVPHLLALVARPLAEADPGAGGSQYQDLGDLLGPQRARVLHPINVGSRTDHLVQLLAAATGAPEELSWLNDTLMVSRSAEADVWLRQALTRIRKVSAVLDAIGDGCLPQLERAASNARLERAEQALAQTYLCRRGSPHLCLADEGARFSVSPGFPVAIRGSPEDLYLSISDAAPDQVRVEVKLASGGVLLDRSLGEGGTATLPVGSRVYILRLKDLWTELIDGRWTIFHIAQSRD